MLLNVGDGKLAAAVSYPAEGYPEALAIGDMNGDQKPDLVVTTGWQAQASCLARATGPLLRRWIF